MFFKFNLLFLMFDDMLYPAILHAIIIAIEISRKIQSKLWRCFTRLLVLFLAIVLLQFQALSARRPLASITQMQLHCSTAYHWQ
jgi:hypothetical protein